ncbi:MAG TPA: serine/threonine-protein kinase, partial [Acetobacteraceae bacterium]|nr:serine/threonine-protein kinase [Acetobacteraceae bacterium]
MADPAATLPAAIGRYRPLAVLGSGGMGTVYRAHDPVIDRLVAIKLVRTEALESDARAEYLDRFRLEAKAAGRCSHPAIIAVFDVLEEGGNPAIVMEFVAGRPLADLFRAGPAARAALPVADLLGQVLEGLGAAHRLGITHRDIKPANILVTEQGRAKIADFGIARLSDMAAAQSLTQAGAMLGTPSYMAPEQIGDTPVDHRADLFAVGAVLYEALTGRLPFAGRSAMDTLQRLAAPEPASMVAVEAAGAGAYVPVLRQALAKPPARRFPSAEAFAAALAAAARSPPPPSAEPADETRIAGTGQATGRWDPHMLARVERALAQYVGPMAKVMVTEAARQAADAETLYRALARSLRSGADRSGFLRAMG